MEIKVFFFFCSRIISHFLHRKRVIQRKLNVGEEKPNHSILPYVFFQLTYYFEHKILL